MSSIVAVLVSFVVGAICGVLAQSNNCICKDCQHDRWMKGEAEPDSIRGDGDDIPWRPGPARGVWHE